MEEMDDAGIYARPLAVLDRHVQIGVAGDRLLSVSFPATPDETAEEDHPLLDRIAAALDGEADDFEDITVALTVPTDQRRVLESLRSVPRGDTVDIDLLTRMTSGLDHEDGADRETVRRALANNPLPVVVPDHRVVDGPSAAPTDVADRLRSHEGI